MQNAEWIDECNQFRIPYFAFRTHFPLQVPHRKNPPVIQKNTSFIFFKKSVIIYNKTKKKTLTASVKGVFL